MKKLHWIFIILFIALLVLPGFIWFGTRIFVPKAFESEKTIEDEKRNPAQIKWGELFSDGSSLNDFYQDRAPFRSQGISLYRSLNSSLEKLYEKTLLPVFSGSGKEPSPSQPGTLPHTQSPVPIPTETAAPTEPSSTEEPEPWACRHEYELTVIEASSCDKAGWGKYTCRLCQDSYEGEIKPLDHVLTEINVQQPDLEHWGYRDYVCNRCGTKIRGDVQYKLVDDSFLAPRVVGSGAIIGRSGWLFYSGEESVSYYKGTNLLFDGRYKEYADAVQRLGEMCEARGIKLFLFFPPNKEQVYREYMPSYTVEAESKRTERLVNYLNENTSVTCLYPLEILRQADLYHETYWRYDVHWSHYGAFVCSMELLKAMGRTYQNPLSLNLEGETVMVEEADIVKMGGLQGQGYDPYPEFKPVFRPEIEYTFEDYEAGGSLNRFTSTEPGGDKLVYLGDSFRVNLFRYVSKSFTESVLAHRFYLDKMVPDVLDCNYLVIQAVERYDFQAIDTVRELIKIFAEN